MMMMMMMVTAIFKAHGSTDLNAQCAEGDYEQKMDSKKSRADIEKFRCTVSLADTKKENSIRQQVSLQTSAERRRGICFPDCVWQGIQELGAELEKALKPSCFLGCFSVALGIRRRG